MPQTVALHDSLLQGALTEYLQIDKNILVI